MNRIFWFGTLSLLLIISFAQIVTTVKFIEKEKPAILTTPYGLALVPLSFGSTEGITYLRPVNPAVRTAAHTDQPKYVQALLPIYASLVFFWFTGMFLYVFSRVKRLERAYILFGIFVSGYMLLFVDYFTQRFAGNFFLSYNILIIAPFLYLYRSVYDLNSRAFIYLVVPIATTAAYFLFPIQSAADELAFVKMLGGIFFLVFVYCAYLFIWSERQQATALAGKKRTAARIFNLTLIFAVAMPPVFFFMLYYAPVQLDINYNALFFLPSFFPIIFLTLSLRWGLVNFHVPISLTAVRLAYFAFFGFLYWFTIGFSLGEMHQSTESRLGHLWTLGFFLLLIDPLRTALITSLDQYTSNRRKILDSFLLKSSEQIANPRRVNNFVERLAASLSDGLGCYWVRVIMSRDLFVNWESDSDKIIHLPPDDPFWTATNVWTRKTNRYPVLTQTFVGPVRDFLQARGGFMVIGLSKFQAGILISDRRDATPFFGEDVRFLRQVAREAEVLIQNYLFLIENVKLKRRERELATNARIQRRIIPGFRQFEHFSFWSYSRAYESVTGDYLDLIQISANKFVVLLGDVSGHGISSGYLAAFARAYLRGSLAERREELTAALGGLNSYLAENYRGNEFITLFALKLEFAADKLLLSYINAGQHPALLSRGNGLLKLEESQRLLGVTETQYRESKLEFERGPARILLYSDGAFDVFNKSGKLLGHKKFYDWVASSLDKTAPEQLAFLRQRIESYTGSGDESDDLALIILEMNADYSPDLP